MRLLWALSCETVSVDRESNRLSLVNIIDEVTVWSASDVKPPEGHSASFALIPFSLNVVAVWARDNDLGESFESRARLRIDEIEVPPADGGIKTELIDNVQRGRAIFKLPGLLVPIAALAAEGAHVLRVFLDARSQEEPWKEHGQVEVRLLISHSEPPSGLLAPTPILRGEPSKATD